MSLAKQLEKQGNWLFRYRGQLPLILFVLVIPVMLCASSEAITTNAQLWTIIAILVSFAGVVVRAYTIGTTPRGTSGRNTKEQVAESLNTSGIYSTVRHPLYLGNYLMWIGIVIFTFNIGFVVLVSLMYWIYYERIMMAEEGFLIKKFGNAYEDWSSITPAFIPSLNKFRAPDESFSIISVFRREYSGWLATVIGFAYVDFLRRLPSADYDFNLVSQEWWNCWMYILIGSVALTLVLRSLKHYTGLLKEEGRS